jgi:prepilin-type N-terminal cleavage/methylation domain-containing protein
MIRFRQVRSRAIRARGFSLIEALIALSVLLILLVAVGDAVSRTLHVAAMSNSRTGAVRTISELGIRLSEEARSASAVFIPATDVLGAANGGNSAHEVDFFRRLSSGGDTYVAYRFDASTGVVTRYEYSLAAGVVSVAHADEVASGIVAFAPVRAPAGSMADVVDPGQVSDVSIHYGTAGVIGGNDVVTLTMQAASSGGVTPLPVEVRLASRVAPTSLSVLVPAALPPPGHGGPIRIPFIIRGAIRAPHGVWHFGDPGGNENPGVHQSQMFGEVQYYGPGDGGSLDWLGLLAVDPTVESGSYSFIDSSGAQVTVNITCDGGVPCPKFRPLPTSGNPPAPAGGVAFDTAP